MRMMRSLMIAAAVAFAAPAVSAQQNSVMQHYRAYTAALERGDVQTAVREAQAALDASQARDGEGGRTAVLALNLATARMLAGEHEQARTAGQRALDLAWAGAEGVNPALAELVVARSTLALASGTPQAPAAAQRLNTLLGAASAETLPDQEVYVAGAELGNWGLANDDFDLAQSGWGYAGARPAGSVLGEEFGLGRARTSEGIAMVLAELGRRQRVTIDRGTAMTAHTLLSEATRVLYPLSRVESPTLELTLAQQTFAEAQAWLYALEAKMGADGRPIPERPHEAQGDADGLSEIGPVDLTRPRCMMRIVARRMPEYAHDNQVATVVLFFRVNAQGEILAHQVAARAGAAEFAEELERVIGSWRVERLDTSAPNCRMESSFLQTVRFVLNY